MQRWAARYASYLAALAMTFVVALLIAEKLSLLYMANRLGSFSAPPAGDVFSGANPDFPKSVLEDWFSMLAWVTVAIGLAVMLPLFRWLSGFGWRRRLLWRHAVLSYFFWVALYFLVQWSAFEGIATKLEALALSGLLAFSVGFVWHASAQRWAEARLERKAQEVRLDAFV